MQLISTLAAVVLLAQRGFVAAAPSPNNPILDEREAVKQGNVPNTPAIQERGAAYCPADKCFSVVHLKPSIAKIASSFCSSYIRYTPAVTRTSTSTSTSTATATSTSTLTTDTTTTTTTSTVSATVTPPDSIVTLTASLTPSAITVSPTCSIVTSTVQATFPTFVNYVSRPPGGTDNFKRAATSTLMPLALAAGCGSGQPLTSKISSACSCFLGKAKTTTTTAATITTTTKTTTTTIRSTSTLTAHTTITTTVTLAAQTQTITATFTLAPLTSTDCQTATTITTQFANGRTCGVPVSTFTESAKITCTQGSAPPGQTVARFRIEGAPGGEGTIFEGCVAAGPENITTPSGGTHLCDGTNNNNNPSPGGTMITAIDAAARLNSFDFDGSFSNQFQDFFISRIAETSQTGNAFWGILRNFGFTSAGGCEEYNSPGEGLWAFDAFNKDRALVLSYDYAVVRPGDTVSLTILQTDLNGSPRTLISGAMFNGQTSDVNGNVAFTAPLVEGCYQYKATLSGAITSPAFYLTVLDSA